MTTAEGRSVPSESDDELRNPPPPSPTGLVSRPASLRRLRIRNLPGQHERDEVMQELDAASREDGAIEYDCRRSTCSKTSEVVSLEAHEQEVRQKAKILEKTFASFGFKVKVVEIETGPVIAQYEVELEAGLAARENLESGRRPGDRPARAERADRGPDSRQEHRRHRGAQQRAAACSPPRGDRGIGRQGQEDADSDLSRQRRLRQSDDRRSQHAAASVDRRPHGHRQERLLEFDHRLDAHVARARRRADADDRSQDGRTQPVQAAAAFDAPRRHRHAQGRGDFGLGGREDGRAICLARAGRSAAYQRLQPTRRRRADGSSQAGKRRSSGPRFRSICRIS